MGTYDIGLPIKQKAVFPPICVACETPNPNSSMEISVLGSDTGSVSSNVADLAFGTSISNATAGNKTVHFKGVQVCSGCESRLKWYHRILKLATYTIWLPGLLIFLVLPTPIWFNAILFVLVIISPAILSMIFPPAFGATVLNGNSNFEFRSKVVYEEFLKLNLSPDELLKLKQSTEDDTQASNA